MTRYQSLFPLLFEGIKSYFENTSIHGFQYVIGSKNYVAKVFWAASICLAFFYCSTVVRKAFEEAEQYPTFAYMDEVEIDELKSPAISVLALKDLDEKAYFVKSLNQVDVCDVDLKKSRNPLLNLFQPVVKYLNRVARRPILYQSEYEVYKKVKDRFDFALYTTFCSMVKNMDAHAFDALIRKAKDSVENVLVVSNVTRLLKDYFTDNSTDVPWECDEPMGDTRVLGRWFDLVAPLEHRRQGIFGCTKEYGFSVGFGDIMEAVERSDIDEDTKGAFELARKALNLTLHQNPIGMYPFIEKLGMTTSFPIQKFCPDLPLDEFKIRISQLNKCPIDLTTANLTDIELNCCSKVLDAWKLQEDFIETRLLTSVQTPVFETSPSTVVNDSSRYSSSPLILQCLVKVQDEELDCSGRFVPSPSTSGLAFSLNRPRADSFVAEDASKLYTEKIKALKGKSGQLCTTCPMFYDMIILPDLQVSRADVNHYDYSRTFNLAIHDRDFIPDFSLNDIKLEAGKEYNIKLQVGQKLADPSLREMDVMKRNCMFKDDPHDLKLFKEYSREACKLECLVNKIMRACQCLPWDFLRPENLTLGLPCYGKQLLCPRAVIDENSNVGCGCPLDCDRIKYTYNTESKPWDAYDYCYEREKDPGSIFNFRAKWKHWRDEAIDGYPWSYDSSTTEFKTVGLCQAILNRGARVTISYQDATATRMIKARRVSTVDLLANLGGTIGLFTGTSILSMVEAAYWGTLTLMNICQAIISGFVAKCSSP